MANTSVTSDQGLLDLLRERGPLGVTALATATKVTPTAVRQRLSRLMDQGLIEREVARAGRGRPSHRYLLTAQGERSAGTNFADLAVVLWQEIRAVKDIEVRRGLFGRLAKSMAGMYEQQIQGTTSEERMRSLARIFADRNVPFSVESRAGQLPVLTAYACPYPQLAEQDRGICVVERLMFQHLLGSGTKLTECRLDGSNRCTFADTGVFGTAVDSLGST